MISGHSFPQLSDELGLTPVIFNKLGVRTCLLESWRRGA